MNINDILSNFNGNQLKEISDFLSSQQGAGIADKLSSQKKEDLLRQFKNLNPDMVKKTLNGLTKEDILKMFK